MLEYLYCGLMEFSEMLGHCRWIKGVKGQKTKRWGELASRHVGADRGLFSSDTWHRLYMYEFQIASLPDRVSYIGLVTLLCCKGKQRALGDSVAEVISPWRLQSSLPCPTSELSVGHTRQWVVGSPCQAGYLCVCRDLGLPGVPIAGQPSWAPPTTRDGLFFLIFLSCSTDPQVPCLKWLFTRRWCKLPHTLAKLKKS